VGFLSSWLFVFARSFASLFSDQALKGKHRNCENAGTDEWVIFHDLSRRIFGFGPNYRETKRILVMIHCVTRND